ncbi:MAG: NAD-glutamate dehydrogenase [Deltaproteobacteria bacterium]|nr:NAD-glutamate dehydrogenase [Deltaproteobacteria bacterium]
MAKQKTVKTVEAAIKLSEEVELSPDAELLSLEESTKSPAELETYIKDIADTVRIGVDQSIAILTPWFFNNMPQNYYQTTPRADKVRHLSSIITGHIFETKQTVELWNRDRSEVTFIGPGNERSILIDMAKKIEPLKPKVGALYFSHDKLLFLSTFMIRPWETPDLSNRHIAGKLRKAKKTLLERFPDQKEEIHRYINTLDNTFVMYGTSRRVRNTYRMVYHMLFKEGVHTFFESFEKGATARLTVGMKEVRASEVLENIFHLIARYGFDIDRSFIVQFEEGYEEPISVLNFILTQKDGKLVDLESVASRKLIKALRTLGWVDTDDYSRFSYAPYFFSVNATNFIRSVASWVHILLSKENPYYFSEHKILTTFIQHHQLSSGLSELFNIKFSPIMEDVRSKSGYAKKKTEISAQIEKLVDAVEKQIFQESLNFTDHILLTNYHFRTKTGLAFRLAPDVLDSRHYPQRPFGIYFIVGRDYRLFHVRWKEIARGGLRIVMPKSHIEYGYALAGLFDEVYGLSYAQQLKNKDIPEGGSKAVMVLKPDTNRNRAAKGAVNALLDLLVKEEETAEGKGTTMVSYYDREETIFLGPDENVTNELIVWITEQAKRRSYKYAKAFMSSKPEIGINHKKYGVTSEGLSVYVDHMLRYLHINPETKPFSVKMTGGPDGDVAGNGLKILHREYGENARIVAISDGDGAAYDPAGLDWQELLKLFKSGESISAFSKSKLSPEKGAFVVKADSADNIRTRNELAFRAKADIFIPAGGRPYTVNAQNYKMFIGEDGTPSCKAVVEGANIFFTNDAREKLQEAGIFMIKDSTANKTGVICSSYEIISSLLLSDQEFLDIKEKYVKQVISILREKAGQEAGLLFKEFSHVVGKKTLVQLSQEISREINFVKDFLLDEFTEIGESVVKESVYHNLILKHCPPILQENFKARITSRLPLPYMIAIIAAQMASYIVYNEGLGWLDTIGERNVVKAVCTYMQNVEDTEKLIKAIEKTNIKERQDVVTILKKSAARVLTMISIEKEHQV